VNGNPEPSPGFFGKGVETRRRASKPGENSWYDEGIVQTTKPSKDGAAKAVEGKKILWPAMAVSVQLRSGALNDSINWVVFFIYPVHILFGGKYNRYYVGYSGNIQARLT
jgi:hypothetical protein